MFALVNTGNFKDDFYAPVNPVMPHRRAAPPRRNLVLGGPGALFEPR
jgi:hypothetical protein